MGMGLGVIFLVACGGLVLLAVVLAVWVIGIYNRLAAGRVGVQGAWADIDVRPSAYSSTSSVTYTISKCISGQAPCINEEHHRG